MSLGFGRSTSELLIALDFVKGVDDVADNAERAEVARKKPVEGARLDDARRDDRDKVRRGCRLPARVPVLFLRNEPCLATLPGLGQISSHSATGLS